MGWTKEQPICEVTGTPVLDFNPKVCRLRNQVIFLIFGPVRPHSRHPRTQLDDFAQLDLHLHCRSVCWGPNPAPPQKVLLSIKKNDLGIVPTCGGSATAESIFEMIRC